MPGWLSPRAPAVDRNSTAVFGDTETQSRARVARVTAWPAGSLRRPPQDGQFRRDALATTARRGGVLASENYQGRTGGDVVGGAEATGVLHAGTARRDDGAIVSSGGRSASVVGTARCWDGAFHPPMEQIWVNSAARSPLRTDMVGGREGQDPRIVGGSVTYPQPRGFIQQFGPEPFVGAEVVFLVGP